MRGEMALPTEPEGAEGALERLLPSVGAHVRGEIALLTAPEGADGALERLLPSVGFSPVWVRMCLVRLLFRLLR